MTKLISKRTANRLHGNFVKFMDKLSPKVKETRAVIFEFEELLMYAEKAYNKNFNKISKDELKQLGFVAYFARYDKSDVKIRHANKNTVVIQFLTKDKKDWGIVPNQIYNFGGAKPPHTIKDEVIIS